MTRRSRHRAPSTREVDAVREWRDTPIDIQKFADPLGYGRLTSFASDGAVRLEQARRAGELLRSFGVQGDIPDEVRRAVVAQLAPYVPGLQFRSGPFTVKAPARLWDREKRRSGRRPVWSDRARLELLVYFEALFFRGFHGAEIDAAARLAALWRAGWWNEAKTVPLQFEEITLKQPPSNTTICNKVAEARKVAAREITGAHRETATRSLLANDPDYQNLSDRSKAAGLTSLLCMWRLDGPADDLASFLAGFWRSRAGAAEATPSGDSAASS